VSALAWVRLHTVGAHIGSDRMRADRVGCPGSIYLCTCMGLMLRHCDRQIPLPASALTHACGMQLRPRASQQIQQLMTPGTGRRPTDQRTWEGDRSHVGLTRRRYSGVLSGLFEDTQRVLSGYSGGTGGQEESRAWVRRSATPGDGCVAGIPVNTFPCTSIERNTETVTRVGVRPARGARGSTARRCGGGRRAAWGQSGRSCNQRATPYAASTPRVHREYTVRWYSRPHEYIISTP
jgi:hypothetical protein